MDIKIHNLRAKVCTSAKRAQKNSLMIPTTSHGSCSLSGRQGIARLAWYAWQGVFYGMLGTWAKALRSIHHRRQPVLFHGYPIRGPILWDGSSWSRQQQQRLRFCSPGPACSRWPCICCDSQRRVCLIDGGRGCTEVPVWFGVCRWAFICMQLLDQRRVPHFLDSADHSVGGTRKHNIDSGCLA